MRYSADELAKRLRTQTHHNWDIAGPFQWATVTAVHTSPNTVDVEMDGSNYTTPGLRYLASYSPTVNDVVMVARMQGASRTARVVLGKLA